MFELRQPFATVVLSILVITGFVQIETAYGSEPSRPNVIFIICDDLNDYIEGFDGHPQARTPHLARLSRTGVSFTQAHCNIPICGPSRASLFTGIYPHNSNCFSFERWNNFEVLQNSRTLMDHFRANGYQTLGTGKLMHHYVKSEWQTFGNRADYGPFAFDGQDRVAHPDVPMPYRQIGPIDGSFGPLKNLTLSRFADGKSYKWVTGSWGKIRDLNVTSDEVRDATADELNGEWAVQQLKQLELSSSDKPFFMGVGFIRPHTPLIVPQKYFDLFPLETIQLPTIKPNDKADTFAHTVRGNPNEKEPNSERTNDMGTRLFNALASSYQDPELGLKKFLQAYLASVASIDDQIGKIIAAVESSRFSENTIIVVTSDHGWGMGEKDYLYKNSLWQESTRVPLIIRAPGMQQGTVVKQAVGLIDLYPTLIDLCDLTEETLKNPKGHPLDGFSLKPFLIDAETNSWQGPEAALTALYKWSKQHKPEEQSYSLRTTKWRYIKYGNGKEELYDCLIDPNEWNNLAPKPEYRSQLKEFGERLNRRISSAIAPAPLPKLTNEEWKDQYFKKHPKADTNGDGKLSWPEYSAYRKAFDPPKKKK